MRNYVRFNLLFTVLFATVMCVPIAFATAPTITITSPSEGANITINQFTEISADVTDDVAVDTVLANVTYPNSTVEQLTLTFQSGNKYNVSFTVPPVPGQYSLLVWANDSSDNQGSSSSTFNGVFIDPTNFNGLELWLDASDNSTLYTDSSCSTQVSSDDQEVLCWENKASKNGNTTVISGKSGAHFRSSSSELLSSNTFLRFNKSNSTVYGTGVDIRADTIEDVTIFAVYRPKTNDTSDQGQAIWGNDDGSWDRFYYSLFSENGGLGTDGVDDGLISLGGASSGLAIDGAGIVDKIFLLTAIYNGNVSGGVNSGPVNGSKIYFDGNLQTSFTDESHATAAQTQMMVGTDGDNGHYDGDLVEMIIYNETVSACQLEVINKYLSGKYGKDFFGLSDKYGFSSPHNNDVNGVGEVEGNCSATVEITSASSSIATIFNPNSLDLNDSLTFAHNNGGFSLTTEAPENYTNRINQSWRADEDNEPGNVSITFDLTGTGIFVETSDFALLIDADTNFSNAQEYTTGFSASGNNITFTGVDLDNGEYFSLGVNEKAPGAVLSNLVLWLDAGTSSSLYTSTCGGTVAGNSDTVGCWEDRSGNDNNVTNTGGARPTLRTAGAESINFNPAVDFDGTDDFLEDADGESYINGLSAVSTFMVVEADSGAHDGYIFNTESDAGDAEAPWGIRFDDAGALSGRDNTFKTGVDTGTKTLYEADKDNVATADPTIASIHWTSGQAPLFTINGENVSAHSATTKSGTLTSADYLRLGDDSNQEFLDATIAEFVHYQARLSPGDQNRVESYLAIKYGITLDSSNDYVDASSNIVYASQGSHSSYTNDIFGIGEDNPSGLSQVRSKSVNSDSVITVQNASDLNQGEFLIIGNDNGALTEGTSEVPEGIATRLPREWRIDRTGDSGTVTLLFNLSGITVKGTRASHFKLLVDSTDADFSSGATSINATSFSESVVRFEGVSFSGDDYLALTTSNTPSPGPGGVNPNENLRLWLRGDKGVVKSGNTLTSWSDQTDFNGFSVFGDPQTDTTLLNFNNVVNFDGEGDYLDGDTDIFFREVFLVTDPINGGPVLSTNDSVPSSTQQYWLRIISGDAYIGDETPDYLFTDNAAPTISAIYNNEMVGGTNANESRITINGNNESVSPLGGSGALNPFTGVPRLAKGTDPSSSLHLNGTIGEIIVYNESLTSAQRARVHTDLAIRYGITLTSSMDYVRSDGTVVYASSSSNENYTNNIAGLGANDIGDLNQTKSLSVESYGILMMEADDIIANASFLLWGNDNNPRQEIEDNLPLILSKRLNRTWLVQKTGTAPNVTISFNVSELNVTGTIANDFQLLVDNNTDFTAGATRTAASNFSENLAVFENIQITDDFTYLALSTDFNNESNYHNFYGTATGNLVLGSSSFVLHDFNGTVNLVFVADTDSSFSFTSLQAIGRTNESAVALADFSDIDTALGISDFNDSIEGRYGLTASSPKQTTNLTISDVLVPYIPIVNSTNSSTFFTGILWDKDDDIDGEYDSIDKEDLVFVAAVNASEVGFYGTYDYELSLPARLQSYKGSTDSVTFYLEIE